VPMEVPRGSGAAMRSNETTRALADLEPLLEREEDLAGSLQRSVTS